MQQILGLFAPQVDASENPKYFMEEGSQETVCGPNPMYAYAHDQPRVKTLISWKSQNRRDVKNAV